MCKNSTLRHFCYVVLDQNKRTTKPTNSETGKIVNLKKRSTTKTFTIQELSEKIKNGATVFPCVNTKDVFSQGYFFLDIDNDSKKTSLPCMSIDDILNRAKKFNLKIAIIHESFTSTEELRKYHFVIALDKPITDKFSRDTFLNILLNIFPEADTSCQDYSRLFFGGTSVSYLDTDAVVNLESFYDEFYKLIVELNVKIKSLQKYNRNDRTSTIKNEKIERVEVSSQRNEIVSAISKLDVNLAKEQIRSIYKVNEVDHKLLSTISKQNIPENYQFKGVDNFEKCFNKINLAEFLGVGSDLFSCIFTDHLDINPSAKIGRTSNGAYYYICFSHAYDGDYGHCWFIVDLIADLSKTDRDTAIDFLCNLFGVSIDVSKNEELNQWYDFFTNENFAEEEPELYQFFKKDISNIAEIILHLLSISSCNYKYLVTSIPSICESMGDADSKRVTNILAVLAFIGITEKADLSVLEGTELKEKIKNRQTKMMETHVKYNHPTIIRFLPFCESVLKNARAEILRLNDLRIVLEFTSRRLISDLFGNEIAEKVYPQYTFKNKKSTHDFEEFLKIIQESFALYGYFSAKTYVEIRYKDSSKRKDNRNYYRFLPYLLANPNYYTHDNGTHIYPY